MAREPSPPTTLASDPSRDSRQATLIERLRTARTRLTNQRSIATMLIAARAHAFTTAMLVEQLRPLGVSRSTVYRTLELLDRFDALARVTVEGRPGYVVCDSADQHYHLTCGHCFSVVHLDAVALGSRVDQAASEQRHFSVLVHLVEVGGRCSTCRD